MNGTRIGLAVLLIGALAAGYSSLRKPSTAESHREARQFVLRYTLARFDDPIVMLGDSNSEASTLPRSTCSHPIVNAGLNGASTASDLGDWLIGALDGKRATAIVVSLGTNDAMMGRSVREFQASYGVLLDRLSKQTAHLFVLAIPPLEVLGRMTAEMQSEAMGRIHDYNSGLPGFAEKNGASFIALAPMPKPFTIDGVHLNAGGYAVWEQAILQKVSAICNSN
jgi:GDSL-like Lipase/Acylhydrolase family